MLHVLYAYEVLQCDQIVFTIPNYNVQYIEHQEYGIWKICGDNTNEPLLFVCNSISRSRGHDLRKQNMFELDVCLVSALHTDFALGDRYVDTASTFFRWIVVAVDHRFTRPAITRIDLDMNKRTVNDIHCIKFT